MNSGQLADGEVPPPGCDPLRFRPIAPFDRDPGTWQAQRWVDAYSGTPLAVTTRHSGYGTHVIRLKTIGDVVAAYERHPEAKSLGPDGRPCVASTRGLRRPRSVQVDELVALGKDTHRFESILTGQEAEWEDVQLAYPRPMSPSVDRSIRRFLDTLTTEASVQAVATQAGVAGRTVYRMKKGCPVGQRSRDAVAAVTDLLQSNVTPGGGSSPSTSSDRQRPRREYRAPVRGTGSPDRPWSSEMPSGGWTPLYYGRPRAPRREFARHDGRAVWPQPTTR